MFRIIIVPYATVGLTDAEMGALNTYNPRMRPNGRYVYAFETLREAREVGMQSSRNYASGCSIFILDDEAGMIVDEARHPKRPQLAWKNMQTEARSGKAATSKARKASKS